jgi:hypothetical protein
MTRVDRAPYAATAAAAILSIHHDIKGRASIPIPNSGIGSPIEQGFGDIVAVVIEGSSAA